MEKWNFSHYLLGGLLLGMSPVYAASPNLTLDISGFLSVGISTTTAVDVDFFDPITKAKTSTVPTIEQVGQTPIFQRDTAGGMKFSANFNDNFIFALQLLSQGELNYEVVTDLLYAEWRIDEIWDLRVGRVRLPFNLFSEYYEIAYTYLWNKPPAEVYGIHQFTDFEGVELVYRNDLAYGWKTEDSLSVGNTSLLFQLAGDYVPLSFDRAIITNFSLSNEILKLNAGYAVGATNIASGTELTVIQQGLENPCALFNPLIYGEINLAGGPSLGTCSMTILSPAPVPAGYNIAKPDLGTAHLFTVKNVNTQMLTFGYEFNWEHFISIAEWMSTIAHDMFIPDSQGWYVLLGYNWDGLTPYVMYADYRTLNNDERVLKNTISGTFVNPYSYYGPPPIPFAQTFEDSINEFLALSNVAQSTIEAGIRYDILPATALKFEYRYVIPREGTAGFFTYNPGKRVSWVTAAINVVF